jgi:hypothetical protein
LELVGISPRRLLTYGVERFSRLFAYLDRRGRAQAVPPHPGTLPNYLENGRFRGFNLFFRVGFESGRWPFS